jgi:hypothetical protein
VTIYGLPREDACCPACPDLATAFRIEDVGLKIYTPAHSYSDDTRIFRGARPAWEASMLEHVRSQPDPAHRELYRQCLDAMLSLDLAGPAAAMVQGYIDTMLRALDEPRPR